MTTIILPPDLEALLSAKAVREGKSVESLAIDGLREFIAAPIKSPPKNLREFLGDAIGRLEGTGESLSENCGERLTEYLVQKQQAGKL